MSAWRRSGALALLGLLGLGGCTTVLPPQAAVQFPQPTNLIRPATSPEAPGAPPSMLARAGQYADAAGRMVTGLPPPAPDAVNPALTGAPASTLPLPQQAMPTRGAIFNAATNRPFFEDFRARQVGDILTVRIVEKVSATQSSDMKSNRSGEGQVQIGTGSGALPSLFSRILGRLSGGVSGSNSATGAGSTQTAQAFDGSITAQVTSVLPNGLLEISGEKQIGVNRNVEVLRFFGQVDPRTIEPGNVVPSTRVANVRLEQVGQGPVGDAQVRGWMSRIFSSISPF
ncbi:flagellar basal body L-ring protein FlgH [Amphibiibacter pelophylacis]|uniref:Flagellar basal body L-ring protein FlgH n=1 Tax=Amphibiibacter pelophylacis TaxID=1799477 RepID=A0ACC6P4L8_9BURK